VLEGKLALGGVTGVLQNSVIGRFLINSTHGLPQDSVSVTGNDLSTLKGRPNVLGDLLVGGRLSDLGLHLLDPSEDLLVGETTVSTVGNRCLPVEGTGKTVKGSSVGEERVGEG
jgi:hypothetical protein